jgi:hypothetical protein
MLLGTHSPEPKLNQIMRHPRRPILRVEDMDGKASIHAHCSARTREKIYDAHDNKSLSRASMVRCTLMEKILQSLLSLYQTLLPHEIRFEMDHGIPCANE